MKTPYHIPVFVKYIAVITFLLNINVSLANDISQEIKSYLTNIRSIAVEFTQSDNSGNIAKGMLIIDKPYKFRCNYYKPFPIVIIGNKNYVAVYDYEMENLSRISSAENIFNFLLVDKINFDNQFEILSAEEQGSNYVIKLRRNDLNKTSEISFDKASKQIRTMKIFEENNIIILNFEQTKQIYDVAKSLFNIKDPELFGKPDRLDKADLQKLFKVRAS